MMVSIYWMFLAGSLYIIGAYLTDMALRAFIELRIIQTHAPTQLIVVILWPIFVLLLMCMKSESNERKH